MAYDIGPKIGIEGEAEYRKQINDINMTMRTLGTEMKAVSSEFIGNEKSIEAYTAKNEVLSKEIDEQQKKLALLQQMLAKSAEKYGESDSKTQRWQQAVNQATADLNKMQSELNQNTNAIESLADKTEEAADALDEGGEAAESFGERLQAGLAVEAVKAGVEKLSDAIGGIVGSMADYSMESETAATRVNSYFGETGQVAQETAGVIKEAFTAGFGDSMDNIADNLIAVKQNLEGLSQTDLVSITEQATQLETIFGSDVSESMRGVNALMQNFGIDAQTAMDYLVAGTQNGLDKTGELGDNLSEYSVKFQEAGYSAEEYFQLLTNGMDNGAYSLDKVNDAINEVTTRLNDGTIGDSIGQYSTKTQELFEAWQNGGATQKEVIESIVGDINNAAGQQEQFNLAQTAFGTLAEDNGVKMVASLTSVGNAYDDVSGKASQFAENSLTSQQKFDSAMRTLQDAFSPISDIFINTATAIAENVTPIIEKIGEFISNLSPEMQTVIAVIAALAVAIGPVVVVLGTVIGAVTTILGVVTPVITALGTLGTTFGSLALLINPVTMVIGSLVAGFIVAYNTSETFRNVVNAAFNAVKDVVSGVLEFIVAILKGDSDKAGEIIDGAMNKISEVINNVLTAIKDWFSEKFNAIKESVSNTINNVKDTINNVMVNIKAIWSSAWDSVSSKITNVIPNIVGAVSDIKNKISEKFHEIINSAKEWGGNLISGFADGIRGAIGKVTGAVENVMGRIKDFIGFHSPSKKGEGRFIVDWGQNMVSGFLDGVKMALGDVSDTAGMVTSTMSDSLTAPQAVKSGGSVNITVNVGSVRNDNDIKAISESLNRTIRNYSRALGVV
nr:MAG TPA: minor tail protein [Caudoviricetes sp.]